SLGSTLQATGKVTDGKKPLANATVVLHMGDVKLADATTNANGDYSFDNPVGVYYFPAAFSSATVYTVVEPHNASFTSTPSAVTTVSVDLVPLYLIIAIITGAILVGLYLYMRRKRGKEVGGSLGKWRAKPAAETRAQAESPLSEARPPEQGRPIVSETSQEDTTTEEPPQEALESPSQSKSAAPLVDNTQLEVATQPPGPELPESVAETGVLKQARDFFERGNDRQAVSMLYDAAVIDVATTHEVTIASHATHWEKYHAFEAAVPEIQEPLLKLTTIYELANYSGRALTDEQRNAAVDAFRAIKAHLEIANA
ncbi:MAG: DUF4129 domain-containing protein, partial [Halobacteriota archaeon]